ncbi:MAG: biosynthetic-type acetolactate synthase large subunit [Lachnospiraceae bacterium]|nr:biosynthetic-type acetolactate synthase large subunit [Lachnospiraceae bacterium]
MTLNGSEILMECLLEQKVDTIFGYPGWSILNVFAALYKSSDKIHHILTSHEQGAAHAADGYARATGRVGVCFATSGPGATNLVTGIATAYMDSIPLVAITANVGTSMLGRDSFQEIDIAGVAMPITKYSTLVKKVEDLAPAIRRAFRLAKSGRPGPVLVDITKDVTAALCEFTPVEPEPIAPARANLTEEDLCRAVEMIRAAKKPFIFAGGGVISAGASEELTEFAKKIDAPVTLSLMGQGAFDESDPAYTGMLGMHGTKASDLGVCACDLLIGIGVRFSDRCTGDTKAFADQAKILHLDVDPAEVNKNVRADASVIGDVKLVLAELNRRLDTTEHPAWMKFIQDLKQRYPLRYRRDVLTGPYIIEKLDELTSHDNTLIVTDVGQHQMWASQYYTYTHPRTFLSSGGLGTMGYGMGAAIGAQTAFPDKLVVNITGDGCFRMNLNELATVSRNELPIVTVIIDNHVLGMVRQWQTLFYGERYSQTILQDAVDYVAVAEAMGVKGYRVTTRKEADAVLAEVIASRKAAVIDCVIDCDDKVFPMVEPNGKLSNVFSAEDLQGRNQQQ